MCQVLRACLAHGIYHLITVAPSVVTLQEVTSAQFSWSLEKAEWREKAACVPFGPTALLAFPLPPLRFSDAGEEAVAASLLFGSGTDHCTNGSVLHPASSAPRERLRRAGFPP